MYIYTHKHAPNAHCLEIQFNSHSIVNDIWFDDCNGHPRIGNGARSIELLYASTENDLLNRAFFQISDTGVCVCVCRVWVRKITFLRYKILFLGNVAPFNLIRPAWFRQFFQRKLDFHWIIYGGDATFCLFTCRCQTNRGSLSLQQIDFLAENAINLLTFHLD